MPAIEYKIIVSYDCPPIGTRALDWSAIDLPRSRIRLDAAATKTGQ